MTLHVTTLVSLLLVASLDLSAPSSGSVERPATRLDRGLTLMGSGYVAGLVKHTHLT